MGSSVSREDPPPAAPTPTYAPPPPYAVEVPPPLTPPMGEKATEEEKVDYLNLGVPLPYEEIQREAMMSLKPDVFEGFRFDCSKGLGEHFATTHSVSMGNLEIPQQGAEVFKVPTTSYDFGANYFHPKLMLIGRMSNEGRLNGRVRYDFTDDICLKLHAQVTSEPGSSQGVGSIDYKIIGNHRRYTISTMKSAVFFIIRLYGQYYTFMRLQNLLGVLSNTSKRRATAHG